MKAEQIVRITCENRGWKPSAAFVARCVAAAADPPRHPRWVQTPDGMKYERAGEIEATIDVLRSMIADEEARSMVRLVPRGPLRGYFTAPMIWSAAA